MSTRPEQKTTQPLPIQPGVNSAMLVSEPASRTEIFGGKETGSFECPPGLPTFAGSQRPATALEAQRGDLAPVVRQLIEAAENLRLPPLKFVPHRLFDGNGYLYPSPNHTAYQAGTPRFPKTVLLLSASACIQ